MALNPNGKTIMSIVTSVLTQSGWVDAICMPIESPEKASSEDIQTGIDEIQQMFYEGGKVELKVKGKSVSFRDVSRNTYKVEASTIMVEYMM